MEMQMVAHARLNVLGVSRFDFDGISGIKVFAQKDADSKNLNVCGIEVVEFGGPVEAFEQFRGFAYPMEFDCKVEMGRGARGKAAMRILEAKPVKVQKAA